MWVWRREGGGRGDGRYKIHSDFWSVHCPSSVSEFPWHPKCVVGHLFVPSFLLLQSADFASPEHTFKRANEAFPLQATCRNSIGDSLGSVDQLILPTHSHRTEEVLDVVAGFYPGKNVLLSTCQLIVLMIPRNCITAFSMKQAGSVSIFKVISRYQSESMNLTTFSIAQSSSTPCCRTTLPTIC